MDEAEQRAERELPIADDFLSDIVTNVGHLGARLQANGSTPQTGQSIVAQAFMAVLWDQYRPQLAHTGAFVNVMAAMAQATVVEMRAREERAATAN